MKKIVVILAIIFAALIAFWFLSRKTEAPTLEISGEKESELLAPKSIKTDYNIPLASSEKRITKKPFGILISPQNSPVSPEKFSGYHTGTDLEIFPAEADADVPVRAICEGEIVQKKKVSGYGGVIIQNCTLNDEVVTVLYGHLKLNDAPAEIGKTFFRGDELAILGAGSSADTDGERKHLHLGIKKGSAIDVRGYVSNKSDLANWLDPEKIIFPPVL